MADHDHDRARLRMLVEAYATACDRRDTRVFRALWLPDARLAVHEGDTAPASHTYEGIDAIATVPERLAAYELTAHLVSTSWSALDGDDATGEALCEAHHVAPAEGVERIDRVVTIRYRDQYRRSADGTWRFAHRAVHKLWTREVPVVLAAPAPTLPPP